MKHGEGAAAGSEEYVIREVTKADLDGLCQLYMELHDNSLPPKTEGLQQLWNRIMTDENHHIIVVEVEGELVSSCVCLIVPNLTHEQRPYALIENVVTKRTHRKRGYASICLDYAKRIAADHHCYKLMLLTGSKQEETMRFYEKAGYNREDKTGFIQWL